MNTQHLFLIKTLGDVVEKSTADEVRSIVYEFTAMLFHRAGFESVERYQIVIQGILDEVENEIKALDTSDVPAIDREEEIGCELGISILKPLAELLSEAIGYCEENK